MLVPNSEYVILLFYSLFGFVHKSGSYCHRLEKTVSDTTNQQERLFWEFDQSVFADRASDCRENDQKSNHDQ